MLVLFLLLSVARAFADDSPDLSARIRNLVAAPQEAASAARRLLETNPDDALEAATYVLAKSLTTIANRGPLIAVLREATTSAGGGSPELKKKIEVALEEHRAHVLRECDAWADNPYLTSWNWTGMAVNDLIALGTGSDFVEKTLADGKIGRAGALKALLASPAHRDEAGAWVAGVLAKPEKETAATIATLRHFSYAGAGPDLERHLPAIAKMASRAELGAGMRAAAVEAAAALPQPKIVETMLAMFRSDEPPPEVLHGLSNYLARAVRDEKIRDSILDNLPDAGANDRRLLLQLAWLPKVKSKKATAQLARLLGHLAVKPILDDKEREEVGTTLALLDDGAPLSPELMKHLGECLALSSPESLSARMEALAKIIQRAKFSAGEIDGILAPLATGPVPRLLAGILLNRLLGRPGFPDSRRVAAAFQDAKIETHLDGNQQFDLLVALSADGPANFASAVKAWSGRVLDPKRVAEHREAAILLEALKARMPTPETERIVDTVFRDVVVAKRAALPAREIDHCRLLCAIVANRAQWGSAQFEQSTGNDTAEGRMSEDWPGAIRFMKVAALVKARTFCPATIDEPSLFDVVTHTAQSASPGGRPASSASVYSRQFLELALGAWQDQRGLSPALHEKRREDQERLSRDLSDYHGNRVKNGDSLFNGYATATTSLYLPTLEPKAYERFIAVHREHVKDADPRSTCRIPYFISPHQAVRAGSELDAAGRAAIFYLALLRHETQSTRREVWRESFLTCAELFAGVGPAIAAHLRGNDTHALLLSNGIKSERAPYYVLPVLPYIYDGLLEVSDAPSPERLRKKVRGIQESLKDTLAVALDKAGLFAPSGSETYPASIAYNNALGVLALSASCALDREQYQFRLMPRKNELPRAPGWGRDQAAAANRH